MSEIHSYRIKYEVHCRFQNFFGKEMVVKNCLSEVQAKYKLGAYCEKKYGAEFECVKFLSVTEESISDLFNDLFEDKNINDLFGNTDMIKNLHAYGTKLYS